MPLTDGTPLATDVVRADDDRRRPVVLVRSPYGRATLRVWHEPIELVRAGWAVVFQDVRGRWDSLGDFDPFRQEAADGAAAVAWCARQPWSNGAVVMTGASYNGVTQWFAASRRPRALRAINPVVSSPNIRDEWIYEGGALRLGFLANWGIGLTVVGTKVPRRLATKALRRVEQWDQTVRSRDVARQIAEVCPWFGDWARRDDETLWRTFRVPTPRLPAYHIAGWWDIFCEGSLAGYAQMCAQAPEHADQRLVVGPWDHGGVFGSSAGDINYGPSANGWSRGFPSEQLSFLADAAAGRPVRVGASVFVMGSNRWLELGQWPPESTHRMVYLDAATSANGPASTGLLRDQPAAMAGRDSYRHDARNPVPTLGGRTLHPGIRSAGPVDQQGVVDRPDVLSYTSDPLARPLTIAGPVRARIWFESSTSVADVTAKLVDVHPDGRAFNVVDSLRRIDTTPNRPTPVVVELGSTAMTFLEGHRLRLEIGSSNFPRFDLLPSADQSVHRGPRTRSFLELPAIDFD